MVFERYISQGIDQPVNELHGPAKAEFIKRLLMVSGDIVPQAKCHIAVSVVNDVPKTKPAYASVHAHKCDEVYLVLGEPGKLTYEITLGNETHVVKSPSAIFVPKRLPHKAEALRGSGQFVTILMTGKREPSLIFERKHQA